MRLLWVVAFVCALGCREKSAPPAPAEQVPPPSAPDGLVAEVVLAAPGQSWERLRALGGERAAQLPRSLPVLIATGLELPPEAAANLNQELPALGVVLSSPEGRLEGALGVHVTSGAELVAALTLGSAPKYRKRALAQRVTLLEPVSRIGSTRAVLGVSGNHLLIGARPETLQAAGRFIAEAMPKSLAARSPEPGLRLISREPALAETLAAGLRRAWQRQRAQLSARAEAERRARRREPDFGDPEVLLDGADALVESYLGVLESSQELVVSVTTEADRLRVECQLTPKPQGLASVLERELVTGSEELLFALPASTRAALLMHEERRAPGSTASGSGASVARVFGDRMSAPDAERLVKSLDTLAGTRHGASVYALIPEPTPLLFVNSELAQPQQFEAAVYDVLLLAELPAVRQWLTNFWGRPGLGPRHQQAGASRAELRFRGAAPSVSAPSLPPELSLTWRARGSVGQFVAAGRPVELPALENAAKLGELPWLAPARPRLQGESALVLYVDLRLLGAPTAEPAPALLAFGKAAARIRMTLEASPAALFPLLRWFGPEGAP